MQAAPRSIAGSEQVVHRYLRDLNDRDGGDALSLVCAARRADFQQRLAPRDYFAYTWSATTLIRQTKSSWRLILTYQVVLTSSSGQVTRTADFDMIDENGPKICRQTMT